MSDKVLGYFLSTVGILIMTVTGLCTAAFGVPALFSSFQHQLTGGDQVNGFLSFAGSVLIFGVLPFFVGLIIFRFGQKSIKKSQNKAFYDENKNSN